MHARKLHVLATLMGFALASCADPAASPPDPPGGDPGAGGNPYRLDATCTQTECEAAVGTCVAEADPKEVCMGQCPGGCLSGDQPDETCQACRDACVTAWCEEGCEEQDASPCAAHAFAVELPEPRPDVLDACVDYVTALAIPDPSEETAELAACDRRARIEVAEMVDVYRCLADTPGATLVFPGDCPVPFADPAVAQSICDRDAEECGSCDEERAARIAASDGRLEPQFLVWLHYCYSDAFDCADRDRCLEAWLAVTE